MYSIVIQIVTDKKLVPKKSLIKKWSEQSLSKHIKSAEVTIRIVEKEEMATLNSTYRHKTGPTNVLSFPFELPNEVELEKPILGDIVICAEVVNREATEQQKSADAHWAHIIIHGMLHLLGYDHESDKDANIMETLEINLLQELGFNNPYTHGDNIKDYD